MTRVLLIVALALAILLVLLPLTSRVSKVRRLEPAANAGNIWLLTAPSGEDLDILVKCSTALLSAATHTNVWLSVALYFDQELVYSNSVDSLSWRTNTTWLPELMRPCIVLTDQADSNQPSFNDVVHFGRHYKVHLYSSETNALTDSEVWLHWWGRPRLF